MRYYSNFISEFNHYPLSYSVDKCVLVGFVDFKRVDSLLSSIDDLYYKHLNVTADFMVKSPFKNPSDCLGNGLYYWSTSHYENRKNLSFFHNFSFELVDGMIGEHNTFWLGFGFNRFGTIDWTHWKIEFNPNKVLPCDFTDELFGFLISNSYDLSLKEFDVAVDFPLSRDLFSMSVNNGRKYSLILNSEQDKTEYSGTRHTNGFTKIYNKTLESKLDTDITRVEFTFTDINYNSVVVGLPDIFITDFIQLKIDGLGELNDTEKFILHTLIQSPERINELGRYMRSKMKNILDNYLYSYSINEKDFRGCIDILKSIPLVKVALR